MKSGSQVDFLCQIDQTQTYDGGPNTIRIRLLSNHPTPPPKKRYCCREDLNFHDIFKKRIEN